MEFFYWNGFVWPCWSYIIFLKDFLSLAFHGYAIYCIYRGLKAIKTLKEIQEYEKQNGDIAEDIYEGKTETQIHYLKQMKEVEDK